MGAPGCSPFAILIVNNSSTTCFLLQPGRVRMSILRQAPTDKEMLYLLRVVSKNSSSFSSLHLYSRPEKSDY